MWSDSESDDEYYGPDEGNEYKYYSQTELELRLLQRWEHEAKNYMSTHLRRRVGNDGDEAPPVINDQRALMHERCTQDDLDWLEDWRSPRVKRFFRDMAGFHLGELDLTGRFHNRYTKLRARWDAYILDFQALAPYVGEAPDTRPELVRDDDGNYRVVETVVNVPVISDAAVWKAFRTKWKLSPLQTYEEIVQLTDYTRHTLERNPQPKFQQLCLVDLPPEILHDVFAHAGSYTLADCCMLASTSKYLHDVGRPFIYISRNLLLGKQFAYLKLRDDHSEEEATAVQHKMMHDGEHLVEQLDFLIGRPDITQKIRSLRLCNNWCNLRYPDTPQALAHFSDRDMFGRVLERMNEFFKGTSLNSLTILGFPIDVGLLHSVAHQSELRDARFLCCRLTHAAQRFLVSERTRDVVFSNLRYIDFLLPREPDGQSSLWAVLALCPHITHLTVRSVRSDAVGFYLPLHAMHARLADPLCSLERIDFDGVGSWILNLELLMEWFRSATAAGPLRVTHLRLVFTYGVQDDFIAELLHELHSGSAPLAVIVLDGLALNGPPTVFGLIAQLFPDLNGLTIMRRANERQTKLKSCHWPRPIYEYAEALSAFSRLRYFGANFSYNFEALQPELLEFFDGPIADEQRRAERKEWRDFYGHDGAALYHQGIARPFATHCPSLEFFVLPKSLYYCVIKRTASGRMQFVDAMRREHAAYYSTMQQYSPDFFSSWAREGE